MGGEQAASVLHLVESEKRAREGRRWAAEEQEEFKRAIRDRHAAACRTRTESRWGRLAAYARVPMPAWCVCVCGTGIGRHAAVPSK